MVIFIWLLVIVTLCGGIAVCGYLVNSHFTYWKNDTDEEKKRINRKRVIGCTITMLITFLLCGFMLWSLYFTESGKRAQKTFRSETSGGLYRIVKVYDMEGELIEQYEGQFDVSEAATSGITKVKFDMDGKRHIIYCTTGTVVIDEIEPKE